jgi:hypothetical protein
MFDHWHHDTFEINTQEIGDSNLLEGSYMTFRLNIQGRVGEMEIDGIASFVRLPEPEKKKTCFH